MDRLLQRFKDLPAKQQLLIIAAIALLPVLILLYLNHQALGQLGKDPDSLIPFSVEGENNLYGQIAVLNGQIKEKDKIIARKAEVEKQATEIEEEIQELQTQLPTNTDFGFLRDTLQAMMAEVRDTYGDAVHIVWGGINKRQNRDAPTRKRSKKKRGPSHKEVRISVELTADINGLIAYIDTIEKYRQLLSIESISIDPGSVNVDADKQELIYELHDIKLDIVTYSME